MQSNNQQEAQDKGSIKATIDNLSSQHFIRFFSIVVLLAGAIFLIATNLPARFITKQRTSSPCDQEIYKTLGYECTENDHSTLFVEVEASSVYSFLILQITPLYSRSQFRQRESINIPIEITAVSREDDQTDFILQKESKELTFDCSFSQENSCNFQQAISLQNIANKNYDLVVRFTQQSSIDFAEGFEIQTVTLNKSFVNYSVFFKFIFFVCSIAIIFWRKQSLEKLDPEFHSQEQKALTSMIAWLVLVNEPFTTLYFTNWLYNAFQTSFYTILSTCLIMLWLKTIDNLAGHESSVLDQSSKFVKFFPLVYLVIAWLTFYTFGSSIDENPLFILGPESSGYFRFFQSLLFVTVLVVIGWGVLKGRNIKKRLDELTERESRFLWFSMIFILIHLYLIVAGGISFKILVGAKQLLFAGSSLLYFASIAYLFAPTDEGISQAQYKKKYDNQDAKDAYKDLEESDEKPKPLPKNQLTYNQLNDNENRTENGNNQGQASQGHDYPFDRKDEEL